MAVSRTERIDPGGTSDERPDSRAARLDRAAGSVGMEVTPATDALNRKESANKRDELIQYNRLTELTSQKHSVS